MTSLDRVMAVVFACLAFPSCGAAHVVDIQAANAFGELVARGDTSIRLALSTGGAPPTHVLDCSVAPRLTVLQGNRLEVELRARPGAYAEAPCYNTASVVIGEMRAGRYSVTAYVLDAQNAVVTTTGTSFEVLPVAGRCNDLPMLSPQIIAQHDSLEPEQLRDRLLSDPAYAARLGGPVVAGSLRNYQSRPDWALLAYPPLRNPTEIRVLLEDTFEFRSLSRNDYACGLPPPDSLATVVEFHHAGFDHYFYSGDGGEIAAIDDGRVRGWTRTGQSFEVVAQPGCMTTAANSAAELGVVYRFYGVPGRGPDSHFFTRDRAECYVVDRSQQWSLEGVPFWAWKSNAAGGCPDPARQVPLYRAWKPFGDSNHRFSTDHAVIDRMVAQGWVDEGAAMCVRKPAS